MDEFQNSPRVSAPSGLEHVAMVINAALDLIHVRDIVAAAGAFILLGAAAEQAVATFPPSKEESAIAAQDPLLMQVGSTAIRMSDARAQAVFSASVPAYDLPQEMLFETGAVDEVVDQVALAEAALAEGLDETLEIKAQLALAHRRILSTAYLDQVVRNNVTDEAVREAYNRAVQAAEKDQSVFLRRIQVASRDEAEEIVARIQRGVSFDEMARRRSLDNETRARGGRLGRLRLSDLPPAMAEAVAELPLGKPSAPVRGEAGWYVMAVDARSLVRLPSLEEMRPKIEASLRSENVAKAVAEARSAVPIRVAEQPVWRREDLAQRRLAAAGTLSW